MKAFATVRALCCRRFGVQSELTRFELVRPCFAVGAHLAWSSDGVDRHSCFDTWHVSIPGKLRISTKINSVSETDFAVGVTPTTRTFLIHRPSPWNSRPVSQVRFSSSLFKPIFFKISHRLDRIFRRANPALKRRAGVRRAPGEEPDHGAFADIGDQHRDDQAGPGRFDRLGTRNGRELIHAASCNIMSVILHYN